MIVTAIFICCSTLCSPAPVSANWAWPFRVLVYWAASISLWVALWGSCPMRVVCSCTSHCQALSDIALRRSSLRCAAAGNVSPSRLCACWRLFPRFITHLVAMVTRRWAECNTPENRVLFSGVFLASGCLCAQFCAQAFVFTQMEHEGKRRGTGD